MNSIKYFAIALLLFSSCKKEEVTPAFEGEFKNGILILNEGLFNLNNSTLSWLDLSTNEVTNDLFLSINNRQLGDTGNDMLLYGNKIYIVISVSSTVEVIDRNTLVSIKQIPFNHNNQSQQPRNLASHNGKVFVSSYDGYVSAIDTSSLTVTNRIKVGRNPEGICISNNSLFVANSGGLDYNNPDSTVFEIDLTSLSVVDTFIVGPNPGAIIADEYSNVYVVKRGNYGSDPSELIRLNTHDKVVTNLGHVATTLTKKGNLLYLGHYDFNANASNVSIFDCSSQTLIDHSLISNQDITTLYGIVPFKTEQLICIDAMNFTNSGYLRFFNSTGQLTNSFNVGLNPNSIIHYE